MEVLLFKILIIQLSLKKLDKFTYVIQVRIFMHSNFSLVMGLLKDGQDLVENVILPVPLISGKFHKTNIFQ